MRKATDQGPLSSQFPLEPDGGRPSIVLRLSTAGRSETLSSSFVRSVRSHRDHATPLRPLKLAGTSTHPAISARLISPRAASCGIQCANSAAQIKGCAHAHTNEHSHHIPAHTGPPPASSPKAFSHRKWACGPWSSTFSEPSISGSTAS